MPIPPCSGVSGTRCWASCRFQILLVPMLAELRTRAENVRESKRRPPDGSVHHASGPVSWD